MTETTLAAIVMPIVNTKPKEGSCGKVLAGLSVKVTNPETGVSLQAKEVGEICFKGDVVMKGYYNNSTATKLTIDKNGWLKTGDLGYYDEDGYFYIVDRLKELIKYKGFQVKDIITNRSNDNILVFVFRWHRQKWRLYY